MQTFIDEIKEIFGVSLKEAFPDLDSSVLDELLEVTQSTQEKFGHYQFNTAMRLGKIVQKNPRDVAQIILDSLPKHSCDFIENCSIAGPGFINIYLKPSVIAERLHQILDGQIPGIVKPLKPQKIVVDFSSPNTAKQLHVGHLRSTIIGDCLARLFEFLGHNVLRLNHIGDWGTPFGLLIAYLKQKAPNVLNGSEKTDLTHLAAWYKESRKLFDEDPDFKKISQLEVVKLQAKDPETLKAWHLICSISEEAYQEIYSLLDITITNRGESFYNDMLPDIVDYLEKKDMVTLSDGAKCVYLPDFTARDGSLLPMIVQKSDGGFNYSTTDMAALKHRIEVEKANRIIYVTDAGQALHFKMFFAAAEKSGFFDPNKVHVDHVTFGLVLGVDGKKLKTRAGESEKLIDLLTEAVDKAETIIKEKNPSLSSVEQKELAKVLGIGAIKYADLSCHRTKDYIFSYDRMLKFEGNTAPFLLYAYVRSIGIKRKLGLQSIDHLKNSAIHLAHPSEIALALHILQFGETLLSLTVDLLPNRLTEYLYNLAEKFHAFFRDCRIIGSELETSRLLLSESAAVVLKQGLNLLGLKTVDKM